MNIKVIYRSSDGIHRFQLFDTLKEAQAYAHHYVGKHPDIGRSYAVSFDGIGVIHVEGCTLAQLFPPREARDANRE
jgi:hypothetical protein